MLEELQRRHYSEATIRYYIRAVERFAQHFRCSPDRLGPRHIREYQAQLFTKRKLSPGTVTNHLCALRFFYIQTLKKPWSITPSATGNWAFPPEQGFALAQDDGTLDYVLKFTNVPRPVICL